MNRKKEQRAQLVSVPDGAAMAGVSPRLVWAWIASGKISVFRFGRRCTRIDANEIEALIEAARQKAT